ncbi:related to Cys2-His2 zinc finger transcription factor ACEI [Cephalotrichum gorgonifer]|uniref:Related to Cys2-His2 zinc finger transcription factor ACEI n=1 Tax=Cephalotrichum gorgonifer TaxID=2041049 RepID=A0AAE8SRV8_9PEZI|nr:related to Cys2-His2 zinc finger transcription factor ACEI [Cephalotrichum gorgonifer]
MAPNPRRTSRPAATRSGNDASTALSLNTGASLRKCPTFHSPTSPSSSQSSRTFAPPSIRRCQTNLDDVVDAHLRRVALIVDDFDKSLSLSHTTEHNPSAPRKSYRDHSLPLPAGLVDLPVVDPAMAARRVLRPRNRRTSNNQVSDSGLGTSISSTSVKRTSAQGTKKSTVSAITRSASNMEDVAGLSERAVSRIHAHILKPLLAKPSLKDFQPIVLDIPRRIRDKDIICLRDLEKTLIFMAPERTKTAAKYLDFCLTSVDCIKTTADYLSDREQTRQTDRPYTNLYFMDLEDQLRQYASQLAEAQKDVSGNAKTMELDASDEVRLHGGLSKNGRPAELVRVKKDGRAFSMATGELVDIDEDSKGFMRMKRSLSEEQEENEDILRSMARRKKNPTPEELAPKKCREPGCTKEFKRPCDLTKHEKTHSRPWKCPIKSCKYHEYGWPTEKEMARHHNDKHSAAPAMYECQFSPCPYKSKRESNCKQHMEKTHGWTYVRTKVNRKKAGESVAAAAADSSTVQQTPQLTNMSTPDSHLSLNTPPADHDDDFMALPDNSLTFPKYLPEEDYYNINQPPDHIPELDAMDMDMDLGMSPSDMSAAETPFTDPTEHYSRFQDGTGFTIEEDIYTAAAHLPTPDPALFAKPMDAQFISYPDAMVSHQAPSALLTPHFSPIGQANAMLFTPGSMEEVDEGFHEDGFGQDFPLFPTVKMESYEPLFDGGVPTAGLGYSQPSQDMFTTGMEWSSQDYGIYNE